MIYEVSINKSSNRKLAVLRSTNLNISLKPGKVKAIIETIAEVKIKIVLGQLSGVATLTKTNQ